MRAALAREIRVLLLQLIVVPLLQAWLVATEPQSTVCGGLHTGLTSGASLLIQSPNYPSAYARNSRCIWLLTAENFTQLNVQVLNVRLDSRGNTPELCKDYLQITEGSATANELGHLCWLDSPANFTVNNLYLWIKFQSDHLEQGDGFSILVTATASSVPANITSPVTACHYTEYECPNKECVFHGNLCDSVNDCGCEDNGCDETKCWTYGIISITFTWSVGVSAGVLFSLVLLLVCGLHEMPQRNRPDCLRSKSVLEKSVENGGGGEPGKFCACFGKRTNRVGQQQKQKKGDAVTSLLQRMARNRHPLAWDSDSDLSRSPGTSRHHSPRHSFSTASGSRRSSSYQLGLSGNYGNTLSPGDVRRLQQTLAAGQSESAAGPKTLAVPTV